MSHFAVLVISERVPTSGVLKAILQPWHEYECTGTDDQYVIDVDVTEETLKDYNEHGKDQSLAEFVEGWSGAFEKERRWYRHTNPNKNGDKVDHIHKKNLDLAGMRSGAASEANGVYTQWENVLKDKPDFKSWDEIRGDANATDEMRNEFNSQPAIEALRNADLLDYFSTSEQINRYREGREAWVKHAEDTALCTYAIVKDGQWFAKGEMGWWGISSGENSEWTSKFAEMLDAVPGDHYLTVVDCHI